MKKYILDESGTPVLEENTVKWAVWFETADRKVRHETIGDSTISTVFLGLDNSWSDHREPILWETMVFDGVHDGEQDRCSGNRNDAIAMHERMFKRITQPMINIEND